MSDRVKLVLPAEARYSALAPELARKYIELAGGSANDADAGAHAVSAAMGRTADGAAAADEVAVSLELEAGGVGIELRCGADLVRFSQPIPVRKP